MSLVSLAAVGAQALLGLVGLGVGGAKVTHEEEQVAEFERFGYPQWFRVLTGAVEIGAGVALLAGVLWLPMTWLGGALLGGVMVGAVATHLRVGDPLEKTAVPTVVLVFTAGMLGVHQVVLL